MPVLTLTQSFIDNELRCPPGKDRIEYCDDTVPGLYILASSSGKTTTYYLRYKDRNAKTCHEKIGRTTDITLVEARKQAKTLKAEISLGADPRGEEKARQAVVTYSDFFEKHYLPYVKPRKRSWKRDDELYKHIRSVPLNDSAIDVLDQLDTEDKFDHLFVNHQTGESYTTIHKVWGRLRRKAGLSHLRIHDLRHQYASFLVNSGRTLYEVQQILGHSDPKVTQRYSHLSSKALQAAANSASIIIRGASKSSALQPAGVAAG